MYFQFDKYKIQWSKKVFMIKKIHQTEYDISIYKALFNTQAGYSICDHNLSIMILNLLHTL